VSAPGQERSSGTRPGVAAPSDVTAGRHALGLLVGDVDAFLAERWGRAPLLRHGQPDDRLTGLLTLHDVDGLLTGARLAAARRTRRPRRQLVPDGGSPPAWLSCEGLVDLPRY